MDPRLGVSPEDLYALQMEVKQVQYAQSAYGERLSRLEKRQADDAALKSVWNSPFPGVLSGTPQHGPVQNNDVFDDLDEQGEQLLGSLHLGPTEEEPARRGAASRANSVRFDESALHGSSWAGHNSRHSGDFAPIRPSSSMMMERSLSHKSDGRHSSAGHSVHSHHSVASGRASSLGLDTNFAVGDDDDSSLGIPGPPASFYVLGTVPSIARCWLTTQYAHATLLYADICSGSQKSTVEYSLVKELGLEDEIQRDVDGTYRVRLNVYFAEAVVIQHSNRSSSPERSVPSMTVHFEVVGTEAQIGSNEKPGIRIFIGSDALRAHSADIFFSKNTMVLYGNDRSRIRVPFVRPEDDATFRHIMTSSIVPEKPKLNANAAPFVLGNLASESQEQVPLSSSAHDEQEGAPISPTEVKHEPHTGRTPQSVSGGESEKSNKDRQDNEQSVRDESVTSDIDRRSSGAGIWGSWRHGAGAGNDTRETPLSGYQPAARGGRNMKILKPQKSASSSARTGAAYEPPPAPKSEGRRKSQASLGGDQGSNQSNRWDAKRAVSSGAEAKSSPHNTNASRDDRVAQNSQTLPRSANPVGGASAFSWMTPPGKPKTPTAAQ